MSKIKKVPAVERVSGLLTKAKQGWATRKSAAFFSMALFCVGAGSMVGCGAGNPLSSGSEVTQNKDLTGKNVAHLDASGELTVSRVHVDHGDTLILIRPNADIEFPQSEVLGIQTSPPEDAGDAGVTFAKGNYLDSYGDKYADIEYLHGGLGDGYRSLTTGEIVIVRATIDAGTTFSGKEVTLYHDNIKLLIYADEYWLNGF